MLRPFCSVCYVAVGQNHLVGFRTDFSGDWDAHWGYDFDFDPWPCGRSVRPCFWTGSLTLRHQDPLRTPREPCAAGLVALAVMNRFAGACAGARLAHNAHDRQKAGSKVCHLEDVDAA